MNMTMAALAAVLVVGGCTSLPDAENVGKLGEALATTGKLIREAAGANEQNAVRIGEERMAHSLLKNRKSATPVHVALRDSTVAEEYIEGLDESPLALAAKALEEYGDALAKAINGGSIEKLEQSSAKFGTAFGALARVGVPGYGELIAQGVQVGARVGAYIYIEGYSAQIRAIVVGRNSDVKQMTALMRVSAERIANLLNKQTAYFELARTRSLRRVSEDPSVNNREVYAEYYAARKDWLAVNATAQAAAKYGRVLKALDDAHEAVATNNADAELFLKRFAALADDLALLAKAAKKEHN